MKSILTLLAFFALTACIMPGRVSEDMTARVKPGMTKTEVRALLGIPFVDTRESITGGRIWVYWYGSTTSAPYKRSDFHKTFEVGFGKDGRTFKWESVMDLIQQAQTPQKDKNP